MKQLLQRLLRRATAQLSQQLDDTRVLLATAIVNQRAASLYPSLASAEFKVFSQFGDDGIIQYLIAHVPLRARRFVELGVEDYREANTRLLLLKDNWSGLVVDANAKHVQRIRKAPLYWRHDLTAVAAFLTVENVNKILAHADYARDVDLLSIDIDGNDYWIWQALDSIQPVAIVVEYNSSFGAAATVTVPYDANFRRFDAHYSGLYWGASLRALVELGEDKGYAFVGCNSAGNNAYFVKHDAVGQLPVQTVEAGFVSARFRESRDRRGKLTFLREAERARLLGPLPVVDLRTGETKAFADVRA